MNMKGKSKTQKGITLIALIITIVVLLILAAVAISSIQNDGILGYAQNAAKDYNQAVANEQSTLKEYLEYLKGDTGVSEELEKYVLGAEGTGRDASEIVDLSTYIFIDEEETMPNASTEIITLNIGWNEDATRLIGYIKYDGAAYKIVLKGNGINNVFESTSYTTESVSKVYEPEGREGTTVAYDSNGDGTTEEWVIITDRNGKVEIVSADVMGSLTLGGSDAKIKANLLTYLDINKDGVPDDLDGDGVIEEGGTDLDGDGTTEVDYQDIAIASYNNAITTINSYCKSLVTATNNSGVRSVGGTNNSATPYSSTNYDSWGATITVDAASGDMQYELDLVKLSYHGKAATSSEYWLASRVVAEYSSYVCFNVRYVYEGMLSYSYLWYVYSDGYVDNNNPSRGVRPVVINPSGI